MNALTIPPMTRHVFLALLTPFVVSAQQPVRATPVAAPIPQLTLPLDTSALSGLRWREIGPYRGGRSVAVGGSQARPNEYYMGTVGGGVFKTTDGGRGWAPIVPPK